jgi:uncharacterized membrane protein YdjX (TVP38/TMEM64 family)
MRDRKDTPVVSHDQAHDADAEPAAVPGADGSRAAWRRFLPLMVLAGALVAFFALDLDRFVSFRALADNRDALVAFVQANALAASLVYLLVYAVATAVSIPGATILTLAGGFLFGIVWGSALTVLGATLGATAVFLAARTALGDALRRKAGPWMQRMEAGFRRDAVSYLLSLRLIPVVPFWLVNLVPAFFGVPLRTFVWTTAVGIVPGTVVYTSVGNGLGATLEAGGRPDLGVIFQPEVLLPLIGLGLLALLPAAWKRWRGPRDPGTV